MNLLPKLLSSKSFKMALKLLGVQKRTWGRMGRQGGVGSSVQVVRGRKRSNWIYVGLIFFFTPSSSPCFCPLIALCFSPISSYLPITLLTPFIPYLLLHLSFSSLFALSLSLQPCLCFPLRALFLGLSNNPHITDLHLDISSCEVRSSYIHSSSSQINACGCPIIFLSSLSSIHS